jgi:hypothetical protein
MGALTIKPLAYKARSWELTTKEITNFLDSFCSQIVVQKRGDEIIRILPSRKEDFFWITDKIRFLFEGLKKQRINYPYIIYKQKYLKVNLEISILFFQYVIFILLFLQELNKEFENLQNKKIKIYKNIFINNLLGELDYISHLFFKQIFLKSNLIKYELKHYLGNTCLNYYFPKKINQKFNNKFNIINDIHVINNYPRIWSYIKNSKILLLGFNYLKNFNCYHLNISIKEINLIERFKSISGILKKETNIFTEEKINIIDINQIILTENTAKFNTYFFDYKINYKGSNKELISWVFCKNLKKNRKGIQLGFQTHGQKYNKDGIIIPITTFLEENTIRLNNKGELLQNIGVQIRKKEERSLLQILKIIKDIIFEKEEKNLTLNFIKGFLLLKYGWIKELLYNFKDYIIIPKEKKKNILLKKDNEQDFIINDIINNSDIITIKKNIKLKKQKNNFF